MNHWHTHTPPFEGTHTHEVAGSNVEHTHRIQNNPDDDRDPIEVVELMGGRYKKPKAPALAAGESTVLDVDNVVVRAGVADV